MSRQTAAPISVQLTHVPKERMEAGPLAMVLSNPRIHYEAGLAGQRPRMQGSREDAAEMGHHSTGQVERGGWSDAGGKAVGRQAWHYEERDQLQGAVL